MLVRFRGTRRALSGLPRNLMSSQSPALSPDVTTRPSAEDGSWSLNFEKRTSRKRTSRALNVTHLPHHPITTNPIATTRPLTTSAAAALSSSSSSSASSMLSRTIGRLIGPAESSNSRQELFAPVWVAERAKLNKLSV